MDSDFNSNLEEHVREILLATFPPSSAYMKTPVFPNEQRHTILNEVYTKEHLRYFLYLRGKLLSGCVDIKKDQNSRLDLLSELDFLFEDSGTIELELMGNNIAGIINKIRDIYSSDDHYLSFGLYVIVFGDDVYLIKVTKGGNIVMNLQVANFIQRQEKTLVFVVPVINPYRSLHVYGEIGLIKTLIMIGEFLKELKQKLPPTRTKENDEMVIYLMEILGRFYPETPLVVPSTLEVRL